MLIKSMTVECCQQSSHFWNKGIQIKMNKGVIVCEGEVLIIFANLYEHVMKERKIIENIQ